MSDALKLIEAMAPEADVFAPAEERMWRDVDRILASPEREPRRSSRARRPALALAAVALAGAVTVPLLGPSSPNVVASAAAALDDHDAIIYSRTETRFHAWDTVRKQESWETDGGRRQREITLDSGLAEMAKDERAQQLEFYDAEHDVIIRHAEPQYSERHENPGLDSQHPFANEQVGDIGRLLDRARRGEKGVRMVGETTIRGVPVYEVRVDFKTDVIAPGVDVRKYDDASDIPTVEIDIRRDVFVDREKYLPVRAVEHDVNGNPLVTTEYLEVRRIPLTPENERLLEMSPHPGADLKVLPKFVD